MSFWSALFSEWTLLICVLLYAFYKWSTATYDFFEKKNVPYIKPIPFFGNFKGMLLQTESFFEGMLNMDAKLKGKKFYGVFELRNPILVVRDPELIKQITVKDFDHFMNHRIFLDPGDEPLFGNSLFALTDQKWKDMRATLSPAFTGSKMRLMFQLMEQTCETALQHLKEEAKKNDPLVIELKEFFTRYTNDVIATSAFGVTINSLSDKDNEFYRMGRKATNFSGWVAIKMFLYTNFKTVMKFLRVRIFDQKFSDYFHHLVLDTMKHREENKIYRPDMINLLMEARKGELKYADNANTKQDDGFATVQESNIGKSTHNRNWTDIDIVAQCFLFFAAGFDTASILMCFCAQELMENPEIQKKLIEEVDQVKEELNGKPLTYEHLQKMKYLDMVMSETLRKWPPAIGTDRVCNKPYTLEDEISGEKVYINKGDSISIPTVAIHYDPQYYPDPKKFDPERFSDENKNKLNQFVYMPFGVGPRNCIGSRFALIESKAIIYHLLTEYTFEVSAKTDLPLQLSTSGFQLQPKKGFWFHLKPRK